MSSDGDSPRRPSDSAELSDRTVSTRKVKSVTEELCGHAFSASTISQINKKLDGQLASFAERPLEEEYPFVVLDARYERVREVGVIAKRAVLIAIGINWEGRRCVLAVEVANRRSPYDHYQPEYDRNNRAATSSATSEIPFPNSDMIHTTKNGHIPETIARSIVLPGSKTQHNRQNVR